MDTPTEVTPSRAADVTALAVFGGATAAAALYGSRFSAKQGAWYRTRRKARFQPPAKVFGPVWTTLYALIAFSGWRIWRKRGAAGRNEALAMWVSQLGMNAAWPKIFFGEKRPKLALGELGAMWLQIARYTAAAWKVDRPAALAFAPYLAWTTFAFALNEEIVRKN